MIEKRTLWLIFTAATLVRLAYTLGLYIALGAETFLVEDSDLYLSLGRDFVTEGDFVRLLDGEPGYRVETERMPLYIIWLAIHQWLSGSMTPLFPALTQGAVDAFACVLIARTAALLDPRLLLPAGLIASFNPTQFVVSAMILTDSLFFFFVCLMLYAAIKWLREPNWRWTLLLGLALGLGVSTRESCYCPRLPHSRSYYRSLLFGYGASVWRHLPMLSPLSLFALRFKRLY